MDMITNTTKTSIGIYSEVNDNIGNVEYIQHCGEDITIVNAARVSFGKVKEEIDEKDVKLINYLIKHKHTSTFEHNTITYRFKVPLFVARQHMRHRTWSYNEISRRYTDIDLEFYEPDQYRTQHKSNRQASNEEELINPNMVQDLIPNSRPPYLATDIINSHHKASLHLYNRLVKFGVCREQARGVLPQNLYTTYYGTCNLNNLLKFIKLRLHDGAQWEIQKVAEACLEIAETIWPISVQAWMRNNT